MPKLTRLRLVCVGHSNARFEDVTLNFQDAAGNPTDSTLWLRNGGGKSSLLNLFFAVVRPDKRDFLGGKAEAKRRKLEDYIQDKDRAVVVCEWEADGESDALEIAGTRERLLTGVFYEWRGGAQDLRRLFFSAKVTPQHPELTLEGIPIFSVSGGKKARRSLSGFRQEWQNLRSVHPHLNVSATEQQVEWAEWLEQARIDPELFSYQLRMNEREGGADDLFKFNEAEHFVDFLLDMVLDPSLADGVRTNIEAFRRELRERNETLVPLRELLTGLISRLAPIYEVRRKRDDLSEGLGTVAGRLTALARQLDAEIKNRGTEAQRLQSESTAAREQAEAAHARARGLKRRVAWLERYIAQELIDGTLAQDEEARARHFDAQRSLNIWKAALYLREAIRFERQAREYRRDLERRHKEQAPLIQELSASAAEFAAALSAQQTALKDEEDTARRAEAQYRAESDKMREESATAQAQASAAAQEARGLEDRLKESKKQLDLLRKDGVVLEDESTGQAARRLAETSAETDKMLATCSAAQSELRGERAEREKEREEAAQHAALAVERASRIKEALSIAEVRRKKLENDEILLRILQLETLDVEAAGTGLLESLRSRLREAAEVLLTLRIESSAGERALLSLEQHGLLPPSRDAEKLLKVLKEHIPTAWSGWTYLSQNTPDTPSAKRKAVQGQPLVALGVVVKDDDYEKACAVARETTLDLETPIALVKQSVIGKSASPAGLILGPGRDAYFDLTAGKEELLRKRHEAETITARIDEISEERSRMEALLRTAESFLASYPKGWFRQQQAAFQAEERACAAAEAAVRSAVSAIAKIDEELARLASEAQAAVVRKSQSSRHASVLEQFERAFGSRVAEWERGLAEAREKRARSEKRMQEKLAASRAAEAAATEQLRVWSQRSLEQRRIEDRLREILPHVKGQLPKPRRGQIDELENKFSHLLAAFEKTVDEAGLKQLAKDCDANADRARKQFADSLSGGVTEKDVQKALDGLDDHSTVERCQADAQQQLMSMIGALGNIKQALKSHESRHEAAEKECRELGVTEKDKPREHSVLAHAEQESSALKSESEKQSHMASALEERARTNQEAAKDADHRVELCKRDLESVEGLKSRFASLLAAVTAVDESKTDSMDSKSEVKEVERRLVSAQRSSDQLDLQRMEGASKLREFVTNERFRALKSELVQRFSSIDDVALEANVAKFGEDLALHLKVTEDHLADKDRHREILIDQMYAVAEEGLGLLRRAQRQSLLPATLQGLGGSQFLHIHLTIPDDPADKRARLGELVDEWVDTGNVPSAVSLIQQAVRRLSRPIRVKVLNPDPDLKAQAVDITEMNRFSGGERLTCAILLYCTLAQLRARTRGLSRSPSSVLLLDNPIGRASRPKFLELQRAVAREMGIQLIYTTGVDDFGALHALPNTIRLRNSRISSGSGRKIVELDAAGESIIDAAQLTRKENGSGALI